MAEREYPRHHLLNSDTGEVEDVKIVVPRRIRCPDPYVAMFQAAAKSFARGPRLSGRTYQVLFELIGRIGWDNDWLQIDRKDIADVLGMQPQNVSRSLTELVDCGMLLRGPRVGQARGYMLNSNFGYKGKLRNLNKHREKVADLRLVHSDAL